MGWHWHGKTHLTCDLLSPWRHQFGTRWGGSDFPTLRNYRLRQIHSGVVLPATEAPDPPRGDGLITTEPGQGVWVCSADCVPVLIGCVKTGQVAALHAGWRGTAARILPTAIQKLLAQGSDVTSLRVALGPAISGANYQVQIEVVTALAATVTTPAYPTVEAVIAAWQTQPELLRPDGQRWRLDLRYVQRHQLLQLGLAPEQIDIAPCCTYADAQHFYSYRRDKQTQVQWSGIASK